MGRVEGLRSIGAEDDEYGVGVGGGEGGENSDELGIWWIREGKAEPRVRDGMIGSF